MAALLLGVDGGNTKTIALVADAVGRILGYARSGCGDIYGTDQEVALAELGKAVTGALVMAGATCHDIASAAFSLAGADWPEDYRFLHTELTRQLAGVRSLTVVNDAIGALRAGTCNGVGVSVVCGTGSAIGSRSADGEYWHTSFWGEDAGAVSIGRKAMRAIVGSELGLQSPTALTARVLNEAKLASVEELLHTVTRRGSRAAPVLAGLARHVLDVAEDGDQTAWGIVSEVGRTLGSYARVAAQRTQLAYGPFALVFAGGVFRHQSRILREHILSEVPTARATDAEFEPATGALLLAFDEIKLEADIAAIRRSLPAPGLFTGETPRSERWSVLRCQSSSLLARPATSAVFSALGSPGLAAPSGCSISHRSRQLPLRPTRN